MTFKVKTGDGGHISSTCPLAQEFKINDYGMSSPYRPHGQEIKKKLLRVVRDYPPIEYPMKYSTPFKTRYKSSSLDREKRMNLFFLLLDSALIHIGLLVWASERSDQEASPNIVLSADGTSGV